MIRPFAQASEQNKQVIFEEVEPYIHGEVLEIGSGTGQHAVYFASLVEQVVWQTSDLRSNLAGIQSWIDASGLDNLPSPIELDVCGQWPQREYDFIYSANCFHIMGEQEVAACMAGMGVCLKSGGYCAIYGPFNYNGRYTADSNRQFDLYLKKQDEKSGIKDFEWVHQLANEVGLELIRDAVMPANNRTVVWQERTL